MSLRSGLVKAKPFSGLLACCARVHTQRQQDELTAFPEIILPLAARELGGDEVVTLLALQEQLLTEYGWRLTLSDLGLLCVCPLLLVHTPEDVAAALERGQVVARVVLDALVTQADTTPGWPHETPQRDRDGLH